MSESFVHTLPLRVSKELEKSLLIRFEAARHVYNACLGEALKRLKLCKESKLWSIFILRRLHTLNRHTNLLARSRNEGYFIKKDFRSLRENS